MKLKPLGDRLIVKAVDEDSMTSSGIILPDTAKEKPQRGRVLAAGEGKLGDDGKRVPIDVSEGDEVLYSRYGGTQITVDGEDLLVLREADVLAHLPVVGGPLSRGVAIPVEPVVAKPRGELLRLTRELEPEVEVREPMRQHAQRNAEARAELIEEFGAYTSEQLAAAIRAASGPSDVSLDDLLADGAIIAVVYRNTELFPGFQFDDAKLPLPVIKDVVGAMTALRPSISRWEIALWFTSRTDWLDGQRPVDCLRTAPEQVLAAARHEHDPIG